MKDMIKNIKSVVALAAVGFAAVAQARTIYIKCDWSADLVPPDTQNVKIYNGSTLLNTITVRAADGWKAIATVPDSCTNPTLTGVPVTNGKATTSKLDYGCKAYSALKNRDKVRVNGSGVDAGAYWNEFTGDLPQDLWIEGWSGWDTVPNSKSKVVLCIPTTGSNVDPIYKIDNTKLPGIRYDANGWSGYRDGNPHSITVVVYDPTDASVEYWNESSGGWVTTNPTFTDVGIYTVNFRITKTGYITVEDSRVVNISAVGTILCSAEGFRGYYDGGSHGITVTVEKPTSGATIRYSTDGVNYNYISSPTYSTGTHTIYYKVTATGYTEKYGSATVEIWNRDLVCTAGDYIGTYDGNKHGVSVSVRSDRMPTSYTTYYSTTGADGTWSTRRSNFEYMDIGEHTVFCKVTATGYNESNVSSAKVKITEGTLTFGDVITDIYGHKSVTNFTYFGGAPWGDGAYWKVGYGPGFCGFWGVGTWTVTFTGCNGYTGTVVRTFTVSPRAVIIRSGTTQKPYDGTPLTYDVVNVEGSGFVAGQGLATKHAFGSQTDVGTSPNPFEYTFIEGTDPKNYDIHVVTGKLTVTAIKPKKLRYPVRVDIEGTNEVEVCRKSPQFRSRVTFSDGSVETLATRWSLAPGGEQAELATSGGTAYITARPRGAGSSQTLGVSYSMNHGVATITNSLVAWYSFDDRASSAYDMSVYNRTGYRYSSKVTLVADRTGVADSAYNFTGASDSYVYVSSDTSSPLNGVTNALTISAWIKPTVTGNLGILYRGSQLSLAINTSGAWVFNGKTISTGRELTIDQWYYVTLTWDGAKLRAYVNGSNVGTPIAMSGSLAVATDQLRIGRTSGAYFKGQMDDVRIYSRALTQDEITKINYGRDVTDIETTTTVSAEKVVAVSRTTRIPVAVDVEDPDGTAKYSPKFVFTTGSTPVDGHGWFGQYETVYGIYNKNDYDAAQSGARSGAGTSWMETTRTGAGRISFWWKTECEETYDYLVFKDGETELARTSGTNGWRWLSFELPDGTHHLRWEYVKDDKRNLGKDAAWVDGLVWTDLRVPGSSPSSQPVRATDGEYDTCVYVTWGEPSSEWPVTGYQVFRNGTNISEVVTARAFTDTTAVPGVEYTYEVKAQNAAGWGSCGTDKGYRAVALELSPDKCHFSNVSTGESFFVSVTSNSFWRATPATLKDAAWLNVESVAGGFIVTASNTVSSYVRGGKIAVTCGLDASGRSLAYPITKEFDVSQSASVDIAFARPTIFRTEYDWRTRLQVTTNGIDDVETYSPVSVFPAGEDMMISFGWANKSDVEVTLPAVKFRVLNEGNATVLTWTDRGGGVGEGLTLPPHTNSPCGFWSGALLKTLPPGDYRLEAELDPENIVDDPVRSDNKAVFRFAVQDASLAFETDIFADPVWTNVTADVGNDFAQAPHVAMRSILPTDASLEAYDTLAAQFGPYVSMTGLVGRTVTTKKPVDIVFLVDYTGSMDPCIAGLINNIGVFIDRLLVGDPERGILPMSDIRIKVVGFSDYLSDYESEIPENRKNWFDEGEFTTDRRALKAKLDELMRQCYGGGGNGGESSYDALYYLCKGWSTVWDPANPVKPTSHVDVEPSKAFRPASEAARAVVLFTDEPPHLGGSNAPPGCEGLTIASLKAALTEADINLTIIGDGFYYKRYPSYAANIHRLHDLTNGCPQTTVGDVKIDKWALWETSDGSEGAGTISRFTQDTSRLTQLAETIYLQVPEETTVVEPALTAMCRGEGTLTFKWCNNSIAPEGDNIFNFSCIGETNLTRRADCEWVTETITLPDGLHPFKWTYRKVDYKGDVSDCGLVADILWEPMSAKIDITPNPASLDYLGSNTVQTVKNEDGSDRPAYGATFDVKCNAIWRVVDHSEWINMLQDRGEGDGNIVITVTTNTAYTTREGYITVEYGLPTDEEMKTAVVGVVQEANVYVQTDEPQLVHVGVKPRWPWNDTVDIDFRVILPRDNTPVTVTFVGVNMEGDELVNASNFAILYNQRECAPGKDSKIEGGSRDNNLIRPTPVSYDATKKTWVATCSASGLYRVSWKGMASDWYNAGKSYWLNGITPIWKEHGFHTPKFSVRATAECTGHVTVELPSDPVRVDTRVGDSFSHNQGYSGGAIITGEEMIGHPSGRIDPFPCNTSSLENGWNALDEFYKKELIADGDGGVLVVNYLDDQYVSDTNITSSASHCTNRFDKACVINNAYVEGGVIRTDTIWKANKVHFVRDNVFVAPGATLTIEAGAVVKFCYNTRIFIHEYDVGSYRTPEKHNIRVKGAEFTCGFDNRYGSETLYTESNTADWGKAGAADHVYSQTFAHDEVITGEYTPKESAIVKADLVTTVKYADGTINDKWDSRTRFYSYEEEWGELPRPGLGGYEFFGWYKTTPTNTKLGSKITNGIENGKTYYEISKKDMVSTTNSPITSGAYAYSNRRIYGLVCTNGWAETLWPNIDASDAEMVLKLNDEALDLNEVVYDGAWHKPGIYSMNLRGMTIPSSIYVPVYGGYDDGFKTAGVYTVTADFTATYRDAPTVSFTVLRRSVNTNGSEIVFTADRALYRPEREGGVARPGFTVRVPGMSAPGYDKDIVPPADYTYRWLDDAKWPWPGTYHLEVTFNDNYVGTLTNKFVIEKNPEYDFTSTRFSKSTAEEARAAATSEHKRILYFCGENATDASTAYVKSLITDDILTNEWVIANFVCWSEAVDSPGSSFEKYSAGMDVTAYPLICVFNPSDLDTPIVSTCGYMEKDELMAFLESSLNASVSAVAATVGFKSGKDVLTYSGEIQKPRETDLVVKYAGSTISSGLYTVVPLEDSIDVGVYELKVRLNRPVTVGTYIVTGETATVSYQIVPRDVSGDAGVAASIQIDGSSATYTGVYNGSVQRPEADKVTAAVGPFTIDYGTDDWYNVGDHALTLTFGGNYSGVVTKTFRIAPKPVTAVVELDRYFETISASRDAVTLRPNVLSVHDKDDASHTYLQDIDYVLDFGDPAGYSTVGTNWITATFIGSYTNVAPAMAMFVIKGSSSTIELPDLGSNPSYAAIIDAIASIGWSDSEVMGGITNPAAYARFREWADDVGYETAAGTECAYKSYRVSELTGVNSVFSKADIEDMEFTIHDVSIDNSDGDPDICVTISLGKEGETSLAFTTRLADAKAAFAKLVRRANTIGGLASGKVEAKEVEVEPVGGDSTKVRLRVSPPTGGNAGFVKIVLE